MNDKATDADRNSAPAQAPQSPGPGEPGRVEWLFRDAARERRIHPLMRLVQDYRRGRAGAPPC
jgi:hypothetical protein